MSKRVLALTFLGALVAFYALRPVRHDETRPEPAPVVDSVASPSQSHPVPPQPTVARLPHVVAKPAPRDDRVEFQIVDGLAIAYGDVIIGQATGAADGDRGRHELTQPKLWSSPEIPYLISESLPRPERVQQALAYFQQATVVRFVPYTGSGDGVVFEPGNEHCFATLGRLGGGLQPVKLADGCGPGEIIHEIMHVLGFIHEQSRPDRDQFIDVLWDNIEDRYRDQYALVPESLAVPLRGSPFDFRSAMLYRPDTFAKKPGVDTMRSKEQGHAILPITDGLSTEDIRRVNRLFGVAG